MPAPSNKPGPSSTPKEGDVFEDDTGKYRVMMNKKGCNTNECHTNERPSRLCDHYPGNCTSIPCASSSFILLTEINYITYRLTK